MLLLTALLLPQLCGLLNDQSLGVVVRLVDATGLYERPLGCRRILTIEVRRLPSRRHLHRSEAHGSRGGRHEWSCRWNLLLLLLRLLLLLLWELLLLLLRLLLLLLSKRRLLLPRW